jgi:GT2 family glycosyltransferase
VCDAIHAATMPVHDVGVRLHRRSASLALHGLNAAAILPVSVCIPAYNAQTFIGRAITAAQRQHPRRAAEIIVVDDASTDATAAVAARCGARVIRHETNRGVAAARNTLLHAATQPWIAYLDADDEWLPHLLETLWPLADGNVLVSGAGLSRHADDPARDYFGGWPARRPKAVTPGMVLAHRNFIGPSSLLMRRDALLAAGGFDETLPPTGASEDMDMWPRILEQGTGLATGRIVTIYHGPGTVQSNRELMFRGYTDVVSRYAERPWATMTVRERAHGVMTWETLRTAMRGGDRSGTVRAVFRLATHPVRLLGAVEYVAWVLRCRRARHAVTRDGDATVAVLPRAELPEGLVAGACRDLRARSTAGAVVDLLLRPTARVAVANRAQERVARLVGFEVFARG